MLTPCVKVAFAAILIPPGWNERFSKYESPQSWLCTSDEREKRDGRGREQ
jgi:hypothetical protein